MGNDGVPAITWLVTLKLPGSGMRGGGGLRVAQIITHIKAKLEQIWVSVMRKQSQYVRRRQDEDVEIQ